MSPGNPDSQLYASVANALPAEQSPQPDTELLVTHCHGPSVKCLPQVHVLETPSPHLGGMI